MEAGEEVDLEAARRKKGAHNCSVGGCEGIFILTKGVNCTKILQNSRVR